MRRGAAVLLALACEAPKEPPPAPPPLPPAPASVRALAEVEHRERGESDVYLLARGHNAFLARLEMPPGGEVPPHRDATEEYIHILEGGGVFTIDGARHEVGPGTTIFMPADAQVSFKNGDARLVAIQVFAGPAPAAKYDAWTAAAPEPAPAPAPVAGGCDPSGTWTLEVDGDDDEDGCGLVKEEKLELALGFADGLVGAGKAAGGGLARLLPAVRAARVVGPQPACGVRVRLGAAGGEHAELLLTLDGGELNGVGTLWGKARGKACSERLSVFGKRSAPAPAVWAGFGAVTPAPGVEPPRPADAAQTRQVEGISAASLLGGATKRGASVPLKGSIAAYVAAVVEAPKAVALLDVACTAGPGRCVAVVGDPCRAGSPEASEDCEGMFLTVVVDPATGKLDRADAGGYPVESQADVEVRLEMAP